LLQSEKMKSVGTLAAGVAHELNNPLMGILNFVQYSLKNTQEDGKIYPVLRDAFQETERCIAIVKNLLTFSHMEQEGDEAFQRQNCKVIMERVLRLLDYRISKENVSLTEYFDEDTPKIYLKSNNIQQVFFNIMVNALDAVKESDRKEIHVHIKKAPNEGNFVCITIRDTGPGIKPEDLPYIFDPFFTTKPVGEGTGLGLSLSYGIVRDHGGEIRCENEPGKGTSFNILLPITKKGREK
jgi:signal transduction histidine kinase